MALLLYAFLSSFFVFGSSIGLGRRYMIMKLEHVDYAFVTGDQILPNSFLLFYSLVCGVVVFGAASCVIYGAASHL